MPDDNLENDPDVIAAKKRLRLTQLSVERGKAIASAIGFFLQTFKAEAISLVSGVTTLALGYHQISKLSQSKNHEVKKEFQYKKVDGGTLEQVGKSQFATVVETPEIKTGTTVTMSISNEVTPNFIKDPESYIFILSTIILIWASIISYFKKRRKRMEAK